MIRSYARIAPALVVSGMCRSMSGLKHLLRILGSVGLTLLAAGSASVAQMNDENMARHPARYLSSTASKHLEALHHRHARQRLLPGFPRAEQRAVA
jgi:hypothetical protein